jgi:MFS family permease
MRADEVQADALSPVAAAKLVNESIETMGMRSIHVRCMLILGLGNAADAVEILSIGYILAVYRDDNNKEMAQAEQEVITAAVFVGMLFGGLACGVLSDRLGRKRCLAAALALNCCSTFASAFAPNAIALALCRLVAGLGVGGSVPTVFTLAAELVPARRRGACINAVAAFWMVRHMYPLTSPVELHNVSAGGVHLRRYPCLAHAL